jgi:hypothetical protein
MRSLIEHTRLADLRQALARQPLWFKTGHESAAALAGTPLEERCSEHRFADLQAFTIDGLQLEDLPRLQKAAPHVMVMRPERCLLDGGSSDQPRALRELGFRVFVPPMARMAAAHAGASAIGTLEFLLSDAERLEDFRALGSGTALSADTVQAPGRGRALFVLDLLQDFEILRPFLVLAVAADSPLLPCVAVTSRVADSHLWTEVLDFLRVQSIPWFRALGPVDVINALGAGRSVLVTAAESSAPGHAFGHQCCRMAPPSAWRVTFQHGHECIGLRHHRAHDLQFPQGVRFASDLIFTWRKTAELGDLHPADANRAVPVGVTKSCADRAETLREAAWHQDSLDIGQPARTAGSLIVAENLHSVRFASPARFQRLKAFIDAVATRGERQVLIRSHPGKRTLEKTSTAKAYRFLDNMLTADDLAGSLGLVSPPSTIVLDGALAARPVAVWSDTVKLGDVFNYTGLATATDPEDLDAVFPSTTSTEPDLRSLGWAVRNTAALNGVPAAWQTLCSLV